MVFATESHGSQNVSNGENPELKRCVARDAAQRNPGKGLSSNTSINAINMNRNGKYRKALFLVLAYLGCWLLMHVFINQDLNLVLAAEYFVQAWSFNGFVRPTYIWWLSNPLFVVVVIVYFITDRLRSSEQ